MPTEQLIVIIVQHQQLIEQLTQEVSCLKISLSLYSQASSNLAEWSLRLGPPSARSVAGRDRSFGLLKQQTYDELHAKALKAM